MGFHNEHDEATCPTCGYVFAEMVKILRGRRYQIPGFPSTASA